MGRAEREFRIYYAAFFEPFLCLFRFTISIPRKKVKGSEGLYEILGRMHVGKGVTAFFFF